MKTPVILLKRKSAAMTTKKSSTAVMVSGRNGMTVKLKEWSVHLNGKNICV